MSYARTTLLLAALTALFMGVGWLIGGMTGMVIALMAAVAMNGFAYWNSGTMVLRMYGAKPADPANAPMLIKLVEQLSYRAGIPAPRVYIIDNPQPNAFATGRNPENAAVAFTEGILETLDREELEGVAAHELAHILNRDILTSTIAATLAGAVMYIAQIAQFAAFFGGGRRNDEEGGGGLLGIFLAAIVAPVAAMLLQMAVSRSREYIADATGAQISGNPVGLANALGRLDEAAHHEHLHCATEATAHMYIANPFSAGGLSSLFSTHPPMAERIQRLLDMR